MSDFSRSKKQEPEDEAQKNRSFAKKKEKESVVWDNDKETRKEKREIGREDKYKENKYKFIDLKRIQFPTADRTRMKCTI